MSNQVEGGRAIARFRLFGFPVHVDISFLVIIGLFGWLSARSLDTYVLEAFLLWMVIAPLAILLHELGHAFMARTTGAQPAIALAGMGGLTTYQLPRPISRGRSFAISVAGPLVGVVIGLPLFWVYLTKADEGLPTWMRIVVVWGWFTNLGWAVLNLVPVLPLDGGQAMRELLPGEPDVRGRRAATISVVTSVLAALAAWWLGQMFIALFFGFMCLTNILALRKPAARPVEQASVDEQVVRLLWEGRPQEARALLQAQPPGVVGDLAIHGAVLASCGDVAQGMALLQQEAARRPADVDVVALTALAHELRGDWPALVALLQGQQGPLVPDVVVSRGVQSAVAQGRPDVASQLLMLRPAAGDSAPGGSAPGGARPSE